MRRFIAKWWGGQWFCLFIILSLTTGLILAACGDAVQTTPTPGQAKLTAIPATLVTASGQNIAMSIELARTSQEQETGLMGRPTVPDGTGMLFVFKQPGQVDFWMKDTPLPLSIAFIDTSGKILDIQDMQAFSEALHTASQPYLYALEVGQGWFARVGVKPGDKLNFKLPG